MCVCSCVRRTSVGKLGVAGTKRTQHTMGTVAYLVSAQTLAVQSRFIPSPVLETRDYTEEAHPKAKCKTRLVQGGEDP